MFSWVRKKKIFSFWSDKDEVSQSRIGSGNSMKCTLGGVTEGCQQDLVFMGTPKIPSILPVPGRPRTQMCGSYLVCVKCHFYYGPPKLGKVIPIFRLDPVSPTPILPELRPNFDYRVRGTKVRSITDGQVCGLRSPCLVSTFDCLFS